MPRSRLDAFLVTLAFGAAVGISAFLVLQVDSSPSPTERAACARARDVRSSLVADASIGDVQRLVRRLAHVAANSEDNRLRTHAIGARTLIHRYHYALVLTGVSRSAVDALPTVSTADTVPSARPAWNRLHRALNGVFTACRRLHFSGPDRGQTRSR